MNWNKSPLAYTDCRDALERALASPNGIKVTYLTYAQAIRERARFNQFRKIHRVETLDIYEPGHPMRGKSVYDTLLLRIPAKGQPDSNVMYIEYRTVANMQIEEL